MGENSKIEWTHHTFNIAWGCTKVSPGCTNCYADAQSHRYGFDVWGPGKERRTFGEKHWAEPLKWNRAAEKAGERQRVFCSSMCDVFEDHPTIDAERAKLWPLIDATPHLDWLLLTKRAERMCYVMTGIARQEVDFYPNVWLGVSVEDQQRADERIPWLLKTPAAVRFLSCEPLLGPVDLGPYLLRCDLYHRPDWVIVGGESGPDARPMHPAWAQSLRDQCQAVGVAYHFKQFGEFRPWVGMNVSDIVAGSNARRFTMHADGTIDREFARVGDGWEMMVRVGKKKAGRTLDGREWDELPATRA